VLAMPTIWGIHNDEPDLDLLGEGFVSVGWDEIGDLRECGRVKDALKQLLAVRYPQAKAGAIPVWAGVLRRFAFEMQVGDYVISPQKADSTVSFGRVSGEYYYDGAGNHHHRRRVEWLRTGVPRATFSQSARYEIGSAVTLFQVKNHAEEFRTFIETGTAEVKMSDEDILDDLITETAVDEPGSDRIEAYTRDFVVDALHTKLDPYRFEVFTAGLLQAMGYRAEVTQASGDGGVDVIAFRDPLGLEPPIIKVQCKRTLTSIGGPDVQKLMGTLAPGGTEVGLFITLGTFTNDAMHLARTRHDLRLVNGRQLVDLIFDHYEQLDLEWRRLLPLKRIYVLDREIGGN
jgi:restriction system protein